MRPEDHLGALPRRVLMTTDAVGGVWQYSLELARGLCRRGMEVGLAVVGPSPTAEQRVDARSVNGLRLWERSGRLEWMEDPWEDLERTGEWLRTLEAVFRPDLIHLNGYVHAGVEWGAPVLVVAHSCVYSWWKAVKGESPPREWDRYRRAVARGLESAGGVVAPSRSMAEELREHYGVSVPVRVIPNGRSAGEHAGCEHKENMVLAVGRLWDAAKNISALDRVASRISWPVYVAGEWASPEGTRMTTSRVKLLGRLGANELSAWMRRSAIYALPARYEPFGLSILEAALSGCALVLGDIASLRENWDGAALFVDPRRDDQIHAGLERVIRDPELRRGLGAAARHRARRFTPEQMIVEYVSAYRELCSRGEPRPPRREEVSCES